MSIIVSRYAHALHETHLELEVSNIENEIKVIYDIIRGNSKLKSLLKHPTEKIKIINEITSNMSSIVVNLCNLLLKNNRIDLLEDIAHKFLKMVQKNKGELNITVTSAVTLNQEEISKIKDKVAPDKKVNVINNIDESVIGGIIIRDGYNVLDLSLKHKLATLRKLSKKEVLACN